MTGPSLAGIVEVKERFLGTRFIITSSMRRDNGWVISGFVAGTSNIPVFVIAYCLEPS